MKHLKITLLLIIVISINGYTQNSEKKEIKKTIDNYFKGGKHLQRIFHKDAFMFSVNNGKYSRVKVSD